RGVPSLGVTEYLADVVHRALDTLPTGDTPASGLTFQGLPKSFDRLGAIEWSRLEPDNGIRPGRRRKTGADLFASHGDLRRFGLDPLQGRVGPIRGGDSILNVLRGPAGDGPRGNPVLNIPRGQDGVGCLGAIVLDSLPGQFGEECRRVSGSDLYRRE